MGDYSEVADYFRIAEYKISMKIPDCHPDRVHQAKGLCTRCYYQAHMERIKRRTKAYAKTPKGKLIQKIAGHNYYVKNFKRRRYGISEEEFQRQVDHQRGLCALCGVKPKRKLCVDHCHRTNRVRALLCNHCNLGIGMFSESIYRLQRAILYLSSYDSKEI